MLSSPPRSRTIRPAAALVLTLTLAAVACGEPPAPTQPTAADRAASALASDIRPAEQHLHTLAREVEGFGGYFIDSNGVVVGYVTDLARGEALRRRLEAAVRAGRLGSRTRSIAIRKGQFDFPSLARWRDIVSGQLLGIVPGVVMSDADEAANRVTIGIDEAKHPGVRADVMGALERLGVPVNAVRFIASGPVSPDVAQPVASTAALALNRDLLDVPSPVVAGYRIFAPGPCTLGPVVEHNGNAAAVTNSHCTSAMYAFDGSSLSTSDFATIGHEQLDPNATCGANCRRSDAVVEYLDAGVAWDLGRIARTVNVTFTWGTAGSLDVDQGNPTRDVIAVVGYWDVVTGMEVYKTGSRTGTTGGVISATCSDEMGSDGFMRACSIRSTYYSSGGDSGSPVYTYIPGTGGAQVRLVAIHWGSNSAGHFTLASYFSWVTSEIPGTFVATRPSPLSAYITGATDVNNDPSCRLRYQAVVTGGAGEPYTYAWNTDGVIHEDYGDVVYAAFPGAVDARFIEVTVTDAVGATVTAGLGITTGPWYDMCYT